MKKIIFMSMLLLTTLTFAQTSTTVKQDVKTGVETVYGDSKAVVSTIYGDIKSMSPKVEEAFKSLATTLKTTSNKVWDLLVRQQKVLSWCYLIGELLCLFTVYRFWKSLNTLQEDLTETNEFKSTNCLITTILAFSSIGLLILSVMHFEPMMTGFMNPEFGALKTIVQVAQTLK